MKANPDKCNKWFVCTITTIIMVPCCALADGVVIDRIYDPYVQPLESEFEWRLINERDNNLDDIQKQFFGFGKSLSDRWAVEIYAIGLKQGGDSLSFNNYELEAKWQLTEQGEYTFDWGMLFELERQVDENRWEFASSLLTSRDFGRWTATTNIGVLVEWGKQISNEVESTLHARVRYRLKQAFEPGFEVHVGQDTVAVGPWIGGLVRLSAGKKLRWELGYFAGFDEQSADQNIKANIEFEF